MICDFFFPYNTRPFTPPSDNLYFRFLRRIAPGLPGVGNRPRWPTRAACLIVSVQLLSRSAVFRSLAVSRTKVAAEKRKVRRAEKERSGCGIVVSCSHHRKIKITDRKDLNWLSLAVKNTTGIKEYNARQLTTDDIDDFIKLLKYKRECTFCRDDSTGLPCRAIELDSPTRRIFL